MADYSIIVTDAILAETLDATSVQSAVHATITTGNLSDALAVDKTYLPTVEGQYAYFLYKKLRIGVSPPAS